jgi:hypothetical protein
LNENEDKGLFVQGRIKRTGAGFSVQSGNLCIFNLINQEDFSSKKENSMHRIIKVSMFVIFTILISAIVSPLHADTIDLYCYLEAITVDVRVEVWEEDRRVNKGQLIWRGIVKKGTRQRINTRTGGIRYAKTVYVDTNEPLGGDRSRSCESGTNIAVP